VSIIYSLLSYNKHGKFDKMLLKAVISSLAATILGWGDTSIVESLDTNSQVIIKGQLQAVLDQLYGNNTV